MDGLFIVVFWVAIVIVGCALPTVYFLLRLWRRSRLLEQQLHLHQQQMEQAFTEIHNVPLQRLAFLMREVQTHEITQPDLLKHLHDVYQDVSSGAEKLHDQKFDSQ